MSKQHPPQSPRLYRAQIMVYLEPRLHKTEMGALQQARKLQRILTTPKLKRTWVFQCTLAGSSRYVGAALL